MVRRPKPTNPFRWVESWPEVIRLVAMMYVRYPQSPRHVENLLLGARGAGGAPRHELLSICALVVNTVVGDREQWRRRWLDYRFMAEQLRPLRSLRAMGRCAA